MIKLFSMFIFLHFFLVGIFIGHKSWPLTPKLVVRTWLYFAAVYFCMGMFVSQATYLFEPQAKWEDDE